MRTLQTLIDECARICDGQNALAERLGVSKGRVSDWRHGRRQVTPEVLAHLCEIAEVPGDEARELLAEVECENPKHAGSREVMRRAFFACLVAGAALGLAGSQDEADALTSQVIHCALFILAGLLCVCMYIQTAGFTWRAGSSVRTLAQVHASKSPRPDASAPLVS